MDRLVASVVFAIRYLPRIASRGWYVPLPPLLKRAFLQGIVRDAGVTTFVETGTYLGDTTWWFRRMFSEIHTVEVDPFLHAQAVRRFSRCRHITAHLGDSAHVLPRIVPGMSGRTLYWLDGHYSAGITGTGVSHCPVVQELEAIYGLSTVPCVIVIDDARCFGADPAYPTINQCRELVATLSGGRDVVSVENDMIVIRSADPVASTR
jgi:hypothetical protein